MFKLLIKCETKSTERAYTKLKTARKGFYNAVYNNPTCTVTLFDEYGDVVAVGRNKKTVLTEG